jgi:hypothetical protein
MAIRRRENLELMIDAIDIKKIKRWIDTVSGQPD